MSLLSELNTIISPLVPLETGVFSDPAPDKYAVITPMVDTFELLSVVDVVRCFEGSTGTTEARSPLSGGVSAD